MMILDKYKLTQKDIQRIEDSLARGHTVEIRMIGGKLTVFEIKRKVKKALDNA